MLNPRRHDPASAAVVVMLRGLKMYGMADAVSDLIEQDAPKLRVFGSKLAFLSCRSCSRQR
jgi:hypothetical protein